MKACEVIVKERTRQLEDCKAELVVKLQQANELQKNISRKRSEDDDETHFEEYVRVTVDGVGDEEATSMMVSLFDQGNIKPPPPKKATSGNKVKRVVQKATKEEGKLKDMIWDLREKTHELRRLTKELVGRVRSLRYFRIVRDLQKQAEVPPVVSCPSCQHSKVPINEVAVLSSCGHTGCLTCVTDCALKEECVYAASGKCGAAARVLNIVKGETLGVDDEARDGQGRHFGIKLEKMVNLIKYVQWSSILIDITH